MTEMIIVDRFDGDFAILEMEALFFRVPKCLLPVQTREGDCLQMKIDLDEATTTSRRKQMQQGLDDLF